MSKPDSLDQPHQGRPHTRRSRKSNGRSRLGCFSCKNRRMKCDEIRPACSQCKASPQLCEYPTKSLPNWQGLVVTFPLSASSDLQTRDSSAKRALDTAHATDTSAPSLDDTVPPVLSEANKSFGSQDAFLLVYFASVTSSTLLGSQSLWSQDATQLAFKNDFLMHTILTLAARHLQKHCPSDCPTYDYKVLEASHLQESLKSFGPALNANMASCQDALLATSFLLFFHACADVPPAGADPTRPCEDGCFTFLRGIQSLVADRSHAAHSGRFKSLVAAPRSQTVLLPSTTPVQGPGALLQGLLEALPADSPFAENRGIYVERIESLTSYFSMTYVQIVNTETLDEHLMACLRWQTFCPAEFVALVRGHDAIALVILAHYYAIVGSVMTHGAKEKWWWLWSKPRYMQHAIDDYLGPDWNNWMAWPRIITESYDKAA